MSIHSTTQRNLIGRDSRWQFTAALDETMWLALFECSHSDLAGCSSSKEAIQTSWNTDTCITRTC